MAKAGLLGEVLVRLEGVSRIGLQLRVGEKAFERAVQGAVVLEGAGLGFGPRFGEDDDVLLPLGLSHVLGEDLMRRAEGLRALARSGELFVDGLDELTATELSADAQRFAGATARGADAQVIARGEVETDGRAVGEERHDGGGRFERRADHRERTLRGRLDGLQEPAAREIVAVIQTQGMWLHGVGENPSVPSEFQPARASVQAAIWTAGVRTSHDCQTYVFSPLKMG